MIVSLYDNKYIEASYKMLQKFFRIAEKDNTEGYAYMALCCYDQSRTEDFMKYLRLAVEENPQEAQTVLNCLFPEGTPVRDYVSYMEQRLH